MADPLATVRAQFDSAPYPRKPLDASPGESPIALYRSNWVTAYYRRNQAIAPPDPIDILDVGCGSGYKTLTLALANPTARVLGVDLSPVSIDLAQKRLDYHQLGDRTAFQVLAMADLPELAAAGQSFDYINCDELLYLQPDPADGLRAMQAVLKPHGIIRANLHSFYQRIDYFKAQEMAQMLGLMDDNPGEFEIEILADILNALKDTTYTKAHTQWTPDRAKDEEIMLMNFLFQRDRGFTIPQLFDFIERGGLEFISMSNWQSWEIQHLFKDPENLPEVLAMSLPEVSEQDRLHFHDLLHSIHRLLDFWCGHPGQGRAWEPVKDWEPGDWERVTVALHPQLQTDAFQTGLQRAIADGTDLDMHHYLAIDYGLRSVSSALAAGLLPLFNGPCPFTKLVQFWQQFYPVDPVTLVPQSAESSQPPLRYLLTEFEASGYVLLERLT